MTVPFDRVGTVALNRLTTLVRQLQGALDGKAIRGGSGGATFTASAFSATVTIAHGLGVIPTSVQVTSTEGAGVSFTATKDATNIYVTGHYPPSALSDTISFDWLAFG